MLKQRCLDCLFSTRGSGVEGGIIYQSYIRLFKMKCFTYLLCARHLSACVISLNLLG